jgi:hypothetical protein
VLEERACVKAPGVRICKTKSVVALQHVESRSGNAFLTFKRVIVRL